MCGISCVVDRALESHGSPGSRSQKLKTQLDASIDLIAHRGPDARGSWVNEDGSVGIAHCRLSINDLSSSASQPLHSSREDIHAVVNGEIYDFDRLQASLSEQFGYQFRTNSDSEVALALYEHYGLDFLGYLRGEFAICIYDERRRLFMAVRDRYGIKPLFWTIHGGKLLVAAEVKAFLGLGWRAEWDVASLVEGGWNFDDRTLFKNVKKVLPGHYLTFDEFGTVRTVMYWDIAYPDKLQVESRTETEMITEVREHMMDAIRLRLRADVPVGVYLSGGIDSSTIAGMAAHLVKEEGARMGNAEIYERICCFSIAFDKGSGFDESDIAERTAEMLKVRCLKKLMTEEELAKRFEDATWHCEHHNHDLNYVGKFALSELPREHGYKVVLTGEGADENFAGYPIYQPDFLWEPDLSWTNTTLDDKTRNQLRVEKKRDISNDYLAIGATSGRDQDLETSARLGHITTPTYMCAFQFDAFAPWAKEECKQDPRATIANATPIHARDKMQRRWHPLHSAMYAWSKGHLANNFLSCLGDRTEMSHSIEARTPFLDHIFTGYVNSLPPSVKVRYNAETNHLTEKWILREAARPFITEELYHRRKHPYAAPTKWPVNGPLHQLFQRLLTEENVKGLGFVDWNGVEDIVEAAFSNGDAKALRSCLMVGQWIVLGQRFNIDTAVSKISVNM